MSSTNDQLSSSQNVKGCNVQVAVRCRPLNADEKKSGQPTVVNCDVENKAIKVAYGPVGKKIMKSFTFDKVFGAYSRQEEVFESVVRPIVDETLAGFNCTIFAYGQTGTGKTHTMEGDIHDKEEAGIVPRAVNAILEQLESSGAEFTIRVSFLELYNEELQDLLNASGDKKLKLCEDVKKGVVCQNLEEIAVLNATDIFDILQRGIQQRQTAATLCNKNSSRSHSIFTMKIMIKEYNVEGEEVVRHGQLNLVDLAGSECIGRSGAKNDRAREAGSINQSLLTLGRVITALVDHHQHVPYRDSKLTRLLQESLGGKAKTCIIATLSPAQAAVEESMSTLDYAHRAKNIKNQPTVNQRLTKKVIMKEYFAEIEQLRNQLVATREKNGVYLDPADFYAMENKIATQEAQLTECEAALKQRNEELKTVKEKNEELTMILERATQELSVTKAELAETKEQLSTARKELEVAFVELKATEEIVKEQAMTEQELKLTIDRLHGVIADRQEEVRLLLSKVQVLEKQETQRLQQNQDFTTSITSKQSSLQEMVQKLMQDTDRQSLLIERGIEEMLSTGHKTCDSLEESISQALKVLIEDTKVSKEFMKQSCETMTSDLTSAEKVYLVSLEGVSKELTTHFREQEMKLESVQRVMQEQMSQMTVLMQHFEQSQEAMMKELSLFAESEEQSVEMMQQHLSQWVESSTQHSQSYLKESKQQQEANAAQLEQKAKKIQETMASMFSEFMAMSSNMSQSSFQSLEKFVSESDFSMNTHSQEMKGHVTKLHDKFVGSAGEMRSLDKSTREGFQENSAIVEKSNLSVTDINKDIVKTIGVKRKMMNEAMTDLSNSYQAITKKTCHGVDQVMQCSEKILEDVTTTTMKMKEQTSIDLEQFMTFLRGNGQALSKEISVHFDTIKGEYKKEDGIIGSSKQEIQTYSEQMKETRVNPTATTPRKLNVFHLGAVQSTRPHLKIKEDAKSGRSTAALRDITYEVIRNDLNKYRNPVNISIENVAMEVESTQPLAEQSVNTSSLKEMMVRSNSTESVSTKTIASVDSMDSENAPPMNTNIVAPVSSSGPSKIARATRSTSKGRAGMSNIATRSRSASTLTATNAVTSEPGIELDFN